MSYNKRIVFPYHTPQISTTGSSALAGLFVTGSADSGNFTINLSGSLDILSGSVDVFFVHTGSGKNITSVNTITTASFNYVAGETGSVPLPAAIASLTAGTAFDVVTRSQNKLRGFSNFFRSGISENYAIEYITVAGGGGGGSWVGGGGGAGGVVTGTYTFAPNEVSTIVDVEIGAGGAGSYNPGGYSGMPNSGPGGNTELRFRQLAVSSSYAYGGGEGQSWDEEVTIRGNGGSGGGRAKSSGTYTGTASQGNNGGTGYGSTPYPCGGGGGYSAVGTSTPNSNSVPGNGGAGGQFALVTTVSLGSPTGYVAGGGGGGCHGAGCNGTSTGGTGGGGNGRSETTTPADNGVTNTGGGGGGSGNSGGSASRGGNGGSGLTVLKMPSWAYKGITTGSPTVVTSAGFTYLAFTQTGTFTI